MRLVKLSFLVLLPTPSSLLTTTATEVPFAQQNNDISFPTIGERSLRRRFDPKTVVYKNPPGGGGAVPQFDKHTVFAIINTPKCGTGGMYSHLSESLSCQFRRTKSDGVFIAPCGAAKGVDIIKAHQRESALTFLKEYLDTRRDKVREKGEPKKCLIITAVRDPKTWLPSKFMEDEKRRYCEADDITPEQTVSHFREWLVRSAGLNRHRAQWNIPHFLDMYGHTLEDQMEVFKMNGGYSLLPPVAGSGAMGDPIEAMCSLLFLHFEQAKRWPEIFKKLSPDISYDAPENRDELCPNNVERYRAVQNYELTDEEKAAFIGNDEYSAYLEDWFRLYGYLPRGRTSNGNANAVAVRSDNKRNNNNSNNLIDLHYRAAETQKFNSNSIIAVVNTPKCGTGGMYYHFGTSYDCHFKGTMFDGVQMGPCQNPNTIDVVKSHLHENAMAYLRQYLSEKIKEGQPKSCLILTAVRDPKTWFPSKFMEDEKNTYCTGTDITPDQTVDNYRKWLHGKLRKTRERAQWNIPHFLKKYGTSLTEQMPILERNGGFSLIPPVLPSPETLQQASKNVDFFPVQSFCTLLFLQVEHAEKWPDVFNKLSPGQEYHAPEDRNELCPDNVDRNNAVKQYQFTREEKKEFIGNDDYSPYLEEWFNVYGFMGGKNKNNQNTRPVQRPDTTTAVSIPTPNYYYDPKDPPKFNHDSIIAVVNTPKCGTGGLSLHFQNSFNCRWRGTEIEGVKMARCEDGHTNLSKSHRHEESLQFLRDYRVKELSKGIVKQCLIVTVVRDPKTWLPSKFMEDVKTKYCESTTITPEQAVQDYREWLRVSANRNRQRAQWNIPHFLNMYETNLGDQMDAMWRQGGYSLLPPRPPPRAVSNESDLPVESFCTLLFLQLESSDRWPEVFEMVAPGRRYEAPEMRDELCPANVERNRAVKSYMLTDEEKMNFIGDDEYSPYLLEWFNAYGYLTF